MARKAFQAVVAGHPHAFKAERHINVDSVRALLASAEQRRSAVDISANPDPIKIEAAYDTIVMCGLAVIAFRGYRVDAERGHHEIVLKALCADLGLSQAVADELDALRRLRNSKYTGFTTVNPADLEAAVENADRVRRETESWFLKEMGQRRG